MGIEKELVATTGVERGDQSDSDYLAALANATQVLPESAWDTLSSDAQEWANVAVFSIEEGLDLPDFENTTLIQERKIEMDRADKARAEEKVKKTKAPKAAKVKAPKVKALKTAKAPKGKTKGNGVRRRSKFGPDSVIRVTTKENPHRAGTKLHNYFKKYKDGMTIAQATKAGIPIINVRYLVGLGHIEVS